MADPLKILVFSDMHGNRRSVDIAKRIVEKDGHDMIVYLGDFSEKIGDVRSNEDDLNYMVSNLGTLAELKLLFGNCDTPELAGQIEDHGLSLHNKAAFKGKLVLVGRGGSHPTPFHTPSEFSESQIEGDLTKILDDAAKHSPEKLILFTHEPPSRTNADKIPDAHVGSDALRHIIEKYQPNLNVCGHIHEAKGSDFIGDTKIINVGQSSSGHFLEITVDGEIKTKEINI